MNEPEPTENEQQETTNPDNLGDCSDCKRTTRPSPYGRIVIDDMGREDIVALDPPTIDLVAALVARDGVTVAETSTDMVITVPRQYPAVVKAEEADR